MLPHGGAQRYVQVMHNGQPYRIHRGLLACEASGIPWPQPLQCDHQKPCPSLVAAPLHRCCCPDAPALMTPALMLPTMLPPTLLLPTMLLPTMLPPCPDAPCPDVPLRWMPPCCLKELSLPAPTWTISSRCPPALQPLTLCFLSSPQGFLSSPQGTLIRYSPYPSPPPTALPAPHSPFSQ